MLNLNSIMIGTMKPDELANFYENVFAKPADYHEGDYYGWQIGDCYITIGGHSEVQGQAKEPARIMFNFETKEVKEEFARIAALGTTVIKEPYEMQGAWIATLADPEGNYFQLMSPWEG